MYENAPFDSTELVRSRPGESTEAINALQKILDFPLPHSFTSMIASYCVGGVAVGSIRFGSRDFPSFLRAENNGSGVIVGG